MRYRQLTASGDYQFAGNSPFLINSPATVAQAVETRLKLLVGEWFLDTRIGLDVNAILGNNTQNTRDQAVQGCILGTSGVTGLASYSSNVEGRAFTVAARVNTLYGTITVERTF